ncbi:MAG: methyltransferase domain-containing protein [Methylibium sp.]|uniref:methyltransferase domain-containing protein n=1 Tax=Methylibium sp. TaxID=2067992 RepID=UPI001835FEB2|nr:methyltransferase domain-containing protein [Methylibium sp.]MBA2722636.1 methyltransferase domain-containing protein [Methylibium sp.]MBA3597234.1 methyltransferase domain-containing protein [Methylibium sp.]
MSGNPSVEFFDKQFERQVREHDLALNPFELAALPHLNGRVLDLGCGMGNLAVAAARRGCSVLALDGSATAIEHLRSVAAAERLDVEAPQVDLSHYEIGETFDTTVSIGLLMFFDCPSARWSLGDIQAHVREGGTAIVNVLIEGTTYLDMFDADRHCLFERAALADHFAQWELLRSEFSDFEAPGGRIKSFATVIARKPHAAAAAGT